MKIRALEMTQKKLDEAGGVEPLKANEGDWLSQVNALSVGEIPKRYPKAFWIVGGCALDLTHSLSAVETDNRNGPAVIVG